MLEKLEESLTAMGENISARLARIEDHLDLFENVMKLHRSLEVLNLKPFAENLGKGDFWLDSEMSVIDSDIKMSASKRNGQL